MEAVELPDQFMAKMYGWQKEYNLPKDSLPLFIALWEKKHGSDPNLLTRMMRGSPKNHKIALDLLYELTEMASKTDGSMAIKELMQNCREILNATCRSAHPVFQPIHCFKTLQAQSTPQKSILQPSNKDYLIQMMLWLLSITFHS